MNTKRFAPTILGAAALLLGCEFWILKAGAQPEVSAGIEIHAKSDFYSPLASCGTWVDVSRYGRCFHPTGIEADWRPYCEGDWVWTDSGWYWESDEPWGWACYHYGTWCDDPTLGWIWVPDVEWSPAWVEWRSGPDYMGWAPCAPPGVTVTPALFAFVDVHHFQEPIRRSLVVVNDATVIQRTSAAPGFKRETRNIGGRSQTVVVNNGPGVGMVEKASGKTIKAVPVQQVARARPSQSGPGNNTRQDNPVRDDRNLQPTKHTEPAQQTQPAQPTERPSSTVRPVLTPPDHSVPSPKTEQSSQPPREEKPEVKPKDQEQPAPRKDEKQTPQPGKQEQPPAKPPQQDNKQPDKQPDHGSGENVGPKMLA